MSRTTPWDEIGNPIADYQVRRVAAAGEIPVYWGKDVDGQCLLIVELAGNHSAQFLKNGTTVHGIGVDLRASGRPHRQRLVLTLEKQVDRDLFFGLCETLVASLVPVVDSTVALAVALTHIKRWKAFLAGRKKQMLSTEQIRGLFAELQFLRTLIRSNLTQNSAVNAWCGANGIHQDFIFGETAVEVKSLSGRERNSVRISSEDQLEGLSDSLFLMIYQLSEMPDSDLALSLNDLVRALEQELTESEALEHFSEKVAAYGYAPLSDYDVPRLLVSGSQCYRVKNGFPRLVRSLLPQGIVKLSYDITLESIKSFECGDKQIFGKS